MLSNREAMHSMRVSNHWAWSQGVGLVVHFLGHKREMWSKIAAYEAMIQAKRME